MTRITKDQRYSHINKSSTTYRAILQSRGLYLLLLLLVEVVCPTSVSII